MTVYNVVVEDRKNLSNIDDDYTVIDHNEGDHYWIKEKE